MQTFNIEKSDSQCIVTWRYVGQWRLLFLVALVLIAWAVLSVVFISEQRFVEFAITSSGALPFAAILFALRYWTVRLVLDETGLELHWKFFSIERKRRFSLDEIRLFQLEIYQASSYGRGRHRRQTDPSNRLRVVCQEDDNADFYTPASAREVNDLCDQLNDFLSRLKTAH